MDNKTTACNPNISTVSPFFINSTMTLLSLPNASLHQYKCNNLKFLQISILQMFLRKPSLRLENILKQYTFHSLTPLRLRFYNYSSRQYLFLKIYLSFFNPYLQSQISRKGTKPHKLDECLLDYRLSAF